MPQNHFFLPELEANIPVPKENAHWFNNDRKIILGISDGILVDEKAVTKGISSIPDIWARPLLFQSAIRPNSKHPLRKKCIQEWRGLMSILALHRIKQELSELEIVAVPLDTETFSTALKHLAPSPVQLEREMKYDWTNVLMIRFKNVPVGAFSPTTLVYTAVDYNHKLKDKPFSFKDAEGYLAPPATREDGLEYLGEWLYNLQQRLKPIFYGEQQNPDHQIVGNINDLLDEWLKEIRQTLNLEENDPIDVRTHKVSEDATDVKGVANYLRSYRVYERLLHPLKKDEAAQDILISDLLLRSARNKDRKIVVITEKALSSQVNIWNERRPNSLGTDAKKIIETFFNAESGTLIGNQNIGKEGGLWIRPEQYFLSPILLKSKHGGTLNEREKDLNINENYLLPFKKEILDFFSPADIKNKLNPSYRIDGSNVKFSFTLSAGDVIYKIEKNYTPKITHEGDGEIWETEVPVIEIFPDYLGENWRRYYLFQGMAEHFFVNPLTEQRQAAIDYRERDYTAEDDPQKARIYEISGDNSFPEALELTNEKAAPLGLVLLSKKEHVQGLKHKWTIGVDFGTSNTNVYKNRGAADTAERWMYNFPEYYRSITNSRKETRDKILEEYFFPTRAVNLPIPSTLKIYNLAKKDAMVLDYFIYYPVKYKFPENVLSDIKWNEAGERKTEYFLESLLFLLLIEVVKDGVAEANLACSYPKAFSATNISVFQREWEAVFDKLLKPDKDNAQRILNIHSGVAADNEIKISIKKPLFRTEGIAAGEYFASELTIPKIEERANKEIAAICLDVGGGTTDISIWYLNNIEFDASVLLAGRQIANLLQINGRVRELLFSKDAAIALEEKKNESSYFSARLNLILKNEEERIQELLVKHANNKDIQWLRQIIALEFGALAFYAAQVCVSTNEKVGGLLSRIADDGINLHWGGNAAKLINWIDFGKYNRDGIASKILNGVFFNCLNDKSLAERAIKPKALMQLQSPGHKSEAAGGLVVMELENAYGLAGTPSLIDEVPNNEYDMPDMDMDNNAHTFYAGIVCGENIKLTNGSTIPFFTPLLNKDLFDTNTTKFQSSALERLIRFVDVLNFFGIKFGLFTEDTKIVLGETEKRIIRDGVLKEFIRMQKLSESQRLIEPVFITEVKLLLEIIKSKLN